MSTPAGWYPDPSGAAAARWWDGAQWTPHTQPGAAAQAPAPHVPSGYAPAPAVPAPVDVPTSTVWVWLAIAASVVPFTTLFLMDWGGFIDGIAASAASGTEADFLMSWQLNSLLVSLVSWAATGLFIVFSWLDWRELRARGIARPFSWAWAFFGLLSLGAAVYMVGRAVVLRSRTVTGSWAPLWVWIAATVAGYIAVFAWLFWFSEALFAAIAPYVQYS